MSTDQDLYRQANGADAPVAGHTAGPWRWEFNSKHKSMTLVGGKPQFDLTIMDFARWGMGGAVAVLRDTAHDGFNIMHRVCDRADWIAPFEGRSHHADWCSGISHPDMRLMASAPDLLAALQAALAVIDDYLEYEHNGDPCTEDARAMGEMDIDDYQRDGRLESARAAIAKATGAPA